MADLDKLKKTVARFPKSPGVYLMKDDRGRVLYVGKATDLRSRVSSYFRDSTTDDRLMLPLLLDEVDDVEYLEASSEVDALLMESRLIKDIQPKYNTRMRDDKSYPWIEITRKEDFSRVAITRDPRRGSRLFGPFTDVTSLHSALRLMQRVFRFRTCKLDISADDEKRRFFRPCLQHSIKNCTAPCAECVSKTEYGRQIDRLIRFLQGKQRDLKKSLKQRMKRASDKLDFEKAAQLRDELAALEGLSKRSLKGDYPASPVLTVDPQDGLTELEELFDLDYTPRSIEGVDIANLGGAESVGALVSFIDGAPFKAGYRRYRIKTVHGVDDYAMIREVLERRFTRLKEQGESYPDILLIDGGKGHLSSGMEVLDRLGIKLLLTLGLSKEEELIHVPDRDEPVRLQRRSPALRLLQHVRDEAHRFAQHYHHLLRRRKTFGK